MLEASTIKLKRSENTSASGRRLEGRIEVVGSQSGMTTWGISAFGAIFVGVGTMITLV